MREFKHPIIGQEAICPDGLGRVSAFCDNFPEQWIRIKPYLGTDDWKEWSPENVKLVSILLVSDTKDVVETTAEMCAKIVEAATQYTQFQTVEHYKISAFTAAMIREYFNVECIEVAKSVNSYL